MILRRLTNEGRRLVTPELASGERERWPEDVYLPLVLEAARPHSLDRLDRIVDDARHRFAPFDTALDPWAAPRLHAALPLTRREAADPALWRYLAVVHRPDFVRHRWENRSWTAMAGRFWRPGTRSESNAFARLWWIAELTRDGGDYTLTERVLRRQPLASSVFKRGLSSHRPVVSALVDALENAPAESVETTVVGVHKAAATVVVEAMAPESLRELVRRAMR